MLSYYFDFENMYSVPCCQNYLLFEIYYTKCLFESNNCKPFLCIKYIIFLQFKNSGSNVPILEQGQICQGLTFCW